MVGHAEQRLGGIEKGVEAGLLLLRALVPLRPVGVWIGQQLRLADELDPRLALRNERKVRRGEGSGNDDSERHGFNASCRASLNA